MVTITTVIATDTASTTSRATNTTVTAGTSTGRLPSLFPPNIPIGKVTKVDQSEVDLYQRVHLRPFASLRRLNFVQVLTKPSRGVSS